MHNRKAGSLKFEGQKQNVAKFCLHMHLILAPHSLVYALEAK